MPKKSKKRHGGGFINPVTLWNDYLQGTFQKGRVSVMDGKAELEVVHSAPGTDLIDFSGDADYHPPAASAPPADKEPKGGKIARVESAPIRGPRHLPPVKISNAEMYRKKGNKVNPKLLGKNKTTIQKIEHHIGRGKRIHNSLENIIKRELILDDYKKYYRENNKWGKNGAAVKNAPRQVLLQAAGGLRRKHIEKKAATKIAGNFRARQQQRKQLLYPDLSAYASGKRK